jgi:hypothetical protein
MIKWEIEGRELATCNCDAGCPCQFNSLPTKGNCSAIVGIAIDAGRFGDISLDGLRAVFVGSWSGAIHHGGGRAMLVIDHQSTPPQREALLKIFAGEETEPGATIFNVFATVIDEIAPPVFAPVKLDIDVERRRGSIEVDNLIEVSAGPILNPVTGAEHRARIDLPNGFEYRIAEVGHGKGKVTGHLSFDYDGSHAHFCNLHLSHRGVLS